MAKQLLLIAFLASGACSAQASWFSSSSTSPDPAPARSGPTYTPKFEPANKGQIQLGFAPFAPAGLCLNDLACSNFLGADDARDTIIKGLPSIPLKERARMFKYFVGKAQLPKYAHSIRAWAACLALCIADVSFVKKAELDKLLKVQDFEKLPEAWKSRAKKNYQNLVKQYGLAQPAKKCVK